MVLGSNPRACTKVFVDYCGDIILAMRNKRHHYIVWGSGIAACIIGVLLFLYGSSGVLNFQRKVTYVNRPVAVPFLKIAGGMKSTVLTRTNYLITSTNQFNKLWDMIDATGTPPAIDFKNTEVAAVFAGAESIANSSIIVTKVVDANARIIFVNVIKPTGTCLEKQKAAPYEIILLPATKLRIVHEDIVATTTCQ
jgi:hypothetical protein